MRHVHIVEDDPSYRASIRLLLAARTDLVVRGFASGDAFLEQDPELDAGVLLLDMHMPGASGLDVLTAVRRRRARHAPLVLTGGGDVPLAVAAMKAGALDFIQKPCEPTRLLALIEAAFGTLEADEAESRVARAARARIAALSPREGDVLRGLIDGRANKAIASELDLSPRTVEIHRARLMEKLDVRSLAEMLRVAFDAGMLEGGRNDDTSSRRRPGSQRVKDTALLTR